MTDKQIIIDVTQCPYYKEDKTCTYLPYKTKCDGDCNWTSYKEMEEQLKRKEQECEELKNRVVELSLFQLYKIQRDESEQTLTEIREMLKEICMEECLFDWNKTNKKHCGDCDCRYGQILQKISEVNNDMENN
jgi:hypothetical protein